MKFWEVTYYEANKYGSMQEKTKSFPGFLSSWEVRATMDKWLVTQQQKGRPVHPQYDIGEAA